MLLHHASAVKPTPSRNRLEAIEGFQLNSTTP
jgi:hypothetical protein